MGLDRFSVLDFESSQSAVDVDAFHTSLGNIQPVSELCSAMKYDGWPHHVSK